MLSLTLKKRETFGKALKPARGEGKLPVVVYGPKDKSASFFVECDDFKQVWGEAGESTIVSLKEGSTSKDVLIHDVAWHPLSGEPLHADFYALDVNKPVKVSVPVEFTGESAAVKNLGGVITRVLHEVEIEVLPKELPHQLEADLSVLKELNTHLSLKDIKLPPSARFISGSDDTVLTVSEPREEEAEEAGPTDVSEVEVEEKGKKEEAEASEPKEEQEIEQQKKE